MTLLSLKKVLFTFTALACAAIYAQATNVYDLRCEMLSNPWGIDNTKPHLSWKIEAEKQATEQTAYQILAASDKQLLSEEKADLWNSGKIKSPESIWINYAGKLLSSRSVVYWKVRIWSNKEKVSQWSETASFSVGLLNADDWQAEYIGMNDKKKDPESPLFRKTFQVTHESKLAFLHVNSLGYHEVYINGKKVSDAILAPAMVQFDKRSLSLTYEVSRYLHQGSNELIIWLGKGWYRAQMPGVVSGGPFVRAQLESWESNHWNRIAMTNDTWKTRESGYVSPGKWNPNDFKGEDVDGSKLLPDFTAQTLNSVSWDDAVVARIPKHIVSPQMVETNRIQKTVHPISIKQLDKQSWLIDMGTCLTGWTKIDFPKLSAHQKITIDYADYIDKNGKMTQEKNFCDTYTASGKGNETFINKFNYHAYRYIKLHNLKEALSTSDITAYLVHTGYDADASSFSCSDKDMNAIHDMIHYTIRCLTLNGYMVDCPHIERLGYGGDGNASTLTVQTMYNLSPLYSNWMQAWGDCIHPDGGMPHTAPCPYSAGGGPLWCGFIITASWQTYVNYGDPRLLERYYPIMQQWLGYVKAYTVDGLLKRWPNNNYRNWYLGDWAEPKNSGVNVTDSASINLVDNCFISVCYNTMSKIAEVLGKQDDKRMYLEKQETLDQLIQKTFYNKDKQSYGTGSQIDITYPLLAGVTPKELIPTIKKTLFNETANRFKGHLVTGLVGIPVLAQWATQNNEADFIYGMLRQHSYPGYLYMIDNGGTTTWEHWEGDRSYIHNCYNGIGSWFYQALGGIVPDENATGYRHVFIRPQLPKGIQWVKTSKDTPFGKLSVDWNMANNKYTLETTIPVGCEATITLPVKTKRVMVNGKKTKANTDITAASGHYTIVAEL